MNELAIRDTLRYCIRVFLVITLLLNPTYTIILFVLFYVIKERIKDININIPLIILLSFSILYFFLYDQSFIVHERETYLFKINGGRFVLTAVSLLMLFNLKEFIFGNSITDKVQIEARRLNNEIKVSRYPYDSRVNTLFVGTSRSGKTVGMLNVIKHSIKNGEFVCAVSGKNGFHDQYSMYHKIIELCKQYNRRLYIFTTNRNSRDNNFVYNPIKNLSPTEVADVLVSVSPFSEEHYKMAFQSWIIAICELLELLNKPISIPNIYTLFKFEIYQKNVDDLFQKNAIDREQYLALLEIEDEVKAAKDSRSRLNKFVKGDARRFYLDEGDLPVKSIKDIRAENAVVIFDLDGLSYKDFSKELGTLITADLRNTIPNDPDISKNKLLVFDELSVFFSDILPDIYSQAMGFGYQSVAGTQSLADLDAVDPTLTERMIENSQQFGFLLQNSASDAQRCSEIVGTRLTAELTNKVSGVNYDGTGSVKVVNEFRLHPNDIKNLKSCEMYCYTKNHKKPDLFKIKWKYV